MPQPNSSGPYPVKSEVFQNPDETPTRCGSSFYTLSGIVVDASGTLYVTETSGAHRVRRIDTAGNVTTLVGDPAGISGYVDGPGPQARLQGTTQLAIDRYGYLYVGDFTGGRIRKVTDN